MTRNICRAKLIVVQLLVKSEPECSQNVAAKRLFFAHTGKLKLNLGCAPGNNVGNRLT